MKENNFTIEQLEKIVGEAPEGATGWSGKLYVIIDSGDMEWCQAWFAGIWGKNNYIHNTFKLTDLKKQLEEMKVQELQAMQVEMDNTAQQVESFVKEDIPIDSGELINELWLCKKVSTDGIEATTYFKPIQTLNNTFTSMQVDELTKKTDRAIKSLEQSGFIDNGGKYWEPPVSTIREQLIWALGYNNCNLSLNGLVQRVSDMKKEYNNIKLSDNESEWKNGNIAYVENSSHDEIVFVGLSKNNSVAICECITESRSVITDKFFVSELLKEKPLTPDQKQQKIDEQNGELLYLIVAKHSPYSHCSWIDSCSRDLYIERAKQIDFKGKLESI